MHRLVRENLEELLKSSNANRVNANHAVSRHVAECDECRDDLTAMREHAAVLRGWQTLPHDVEPRAGFYARVMERIETQGPASIWNLFFDSIFGRRLAIASLALAVLLGVYLVSTESAAPELAFTESHAVEVLPVPVVTGQFVAMHDQAGVMLPGEPDEDSVLVNLVTYQEQ